MALKPTTSLDARVILTDGSKRSVRLQTGVVDCIRGGSVTKHAAAVVELWGHSCTKCACSEHSSQLFAQVDVSQIVRIEQVLVDGESNVPSSLVCYEIITTIWSQIDRVAGRCAEADMSTFVHSIDSNRSMLYVLAGPSALQKSQAKLFFDELWILVNFLGERSPSIDILVEECTLPSNAVSEASMYLKSLLNRQGVNTSCAKVKAETCEELPPHSDENVANSCNIVESTILDLPAVTSQELLDGGVCFNASQCRWPVVVEAAQARGWRIVFEEEDGDMNALQCNVHWFGYKQIHHSLQKVQPWMRVNRFPGLHSLLGRKCHLARTMTRLKKICPTEYDFIPRTWILPQDFHELTSRFAREADPTVYIVKPDVSSQGRGIFLTDDLERIRKLLEEERESGQMRTFAVQKYIPNPMLLDGYKFDLRVYFLVSGAPTDAGLELRCFMFRDGLVRLCTQEYKAPTRDTFEQSYMHLTNYEVNKTSEEFKHNKDKTDNGTGSKRSLAWLMDYIESEFGKEERERVWMEIHGICVKTILSVQLSLEVEYDTAFPRDRTGYCMGCRSFAILGFDVLLTSQRKAYLIEVNHLPSLNTDSPLDYDIKRRLVDQALDMTCSHLAATDSESYRTRFRLNLPAQNPLLEEPRYKDFERAFPPTDDCPPVVAAQYASVQSRIREVFKPIMTGGWRRDFESEAHARALYFGRANSVGMNSSRSAWAKTPAQRRSVVKSQRL